MSPDQSSTLGRKTLVGIGWIGAWRMVARGLGFISTLVLARLLFPTDFGLVAMASAFAGAIGSLSEFPVEDALVRRIETDTRLHDVAFTFQFGRALATGGLMALTAPIAAQWFSEPRLTAVVLVLAGLTAISGLDNIGIVEFRRQMRFDVQFRILLVPRLLQFFSTILAAWLTHSYWALLIGIGVQRLSRLVATYLIHSYRPRISLSGWRDIAGFSLWLWATGLLSLAWDRYDTFLVGHYFGSAALGLYMVASQIAMLPVAELVIPAAGVLLAGFAFSRRSGGTATTNAVPLSTALFFVVTPMALVLSFGSSYVVALLLGGKWGAAAPLISIIAWACLAAPLRQICGAVLITIGEVRRQFIAVAAASLVRVVVVYIAARYFSLAAVAVAAVGLSSLEALFFVLQVRAVGYARLRHSAFGLIRGAVAAMATLFVLARWGAAWSPTLPSIALSSPYVNSLVHLVILGTLALTTFVVSGAVAWVVSGRPEGPEKLLVRLGYSVITRRAM